MDDAPLFDIDDARLRRRKAPQKAHVARQYKGPLATCHVCTINVSKGILPMERQPATTEVIERGDIWLLCSLHASEVRSGHLKLPTRGERKL